MGSGTLTARTNGQTIDETWFNQFRTAFNQDFYPRNSSGAVTDVGGAIGTLSYRFSALHLLGYSYLHDGSTSFYMRQGLTPGLAANQTVFWPANLPSALSTMPLQMTTADGVTGTLEYSAIGTAGIANTAVTQAKLASRATGTSVAAGGVAISNSCGNFNTISATHVDVTNLSVTITTTGRPVFMTIIPDGTTDAGNITTAGGIYEIAFLSGATPIAYWAPNGNTNSAYMWPVYVYPISAGTTTFKVTAASINTNNLNIRYFKLVVYEI